jgi:ABC-type sugar transport system substrate-binding protein
MKLRQRGRYLAPLAVLVLLVTAACGSSDSSTAEPETDTGSESSSSSGDPADDPMAAATEALAGFTNTDGLQYPEPPGAFDPGSHKVAIISCGQTGIGCQQMSEFAQNAAAAAGWEASPTFDGKFDPNQQAAYVQQALNQGYDAIILASIDAKSIQAAIDAANAADVPVACIMCENAGMEEQVMDATTGGYNGGLALSTFVTVAVGGKGNIVGFDDKSFPIVAARMTGLQDGLKEYCPDCTYSQEDFPTTDLAKPGPPTWNGFLSANPPGKVQLVAGPYDFMSLPAAKTTQQAGRDDPLITGFDAYSEFVKAIETADPPTAAATIAAPFEYCAWAAMDNVARVVAGEDTWDMSKLPVAVVDKDNASEFSDGYLKPPFSVPDMFTELWGTSS